jgi:hypothetical protein
MHVRYIAVLAFAAITSGMSPLGAQSPSSRPDVRVASLAVAPTPVLPLTVVDSVSAVASNSAADSVTEPGAASAVVRGPSIASARVASRVATTHRGAPPAIQNKSSNHKSVALMIVGGAALVIGAVIGDDAGTFVMLGGAAIGLYGLYLFLT